MNRTEQLDEIGWDDPRLDKLWRYNQHYFDDLTAADACLRRAWHESLITDWIEANPPGRGTGWEPYPASLRIVNWIKFALGGGDLDSRQLHSLAVQSRWLTRRLEWHLLGNHLFANAKALLFAGLFFDGREPHRWLSQAVSILRAQLPEQFLDDGGQFELSPMYHGIAVEDVLDIVNISRCYASALDTDATELLEECAERIPAMLHWMGAMCHPDGEIAFFNDAAIGIAPSLSALMAYAKRLGFDPAPRIDRKIWLKNSGYARLSTDGAVLITDMAPVGPDYLPGHAHADTLSFEFSIGRERLIVNGGTSTYAEGAERIRQRSSAAHNTVVVGGQNSSDIWRSFRVGRRARPFDLYVEEDGGMISAGAGHDGYLGLAQRVIHRRRWELSAGSLTISDTVTGGVGAEMHLHFHPDVHVTHLDEHGGTVTLAGGLSARWRVDGGCARLNSTTWHPQFGVSIANKSLAVAFDHGAISFTLQWP